MREIVASTASIVRELVDSDPFLQHCLARRIVNFSEAARRLQPLVEARLGRRVSLESVKMALIRYAERLADQAGSSSRAVLKILAESVVELRMGVGLATFELQALRGILEAVAELAPRARFFSLMQTPVSITVIADNETVKKIVERVGKEHVVDMRLDQAAIVLVSPREIVETPGVMAYVSTLMAQHGVNMLQVESCYTETVMIVSRSDAQKAFAVLEAAIEAAREALGEEKD